MKSIGRRLKSLTLNVAVCRGMLAALCEAMLFIILVAGAAMAEGIRLREPSYHKDLVAFYSFDDDSGGKVYDESGNGNHAFTVGDVQYEASLKGRAPRFTSNRTYIVSDSPGLNMNGWRKVTVSAWINTNRVTTYSRIIGRGAVTADRGSGIGLQAGSSVSKASFGIVRQFQTNKPVQEQIYTSSLMPKNFKRERRWVHMAATFDGQFMRLYINGELDREAEAGSVGLKIWDREDHKLVIGNSANKSRMSWTDKYFDGLIDEVKIWRRALDPKEIEQLHAKGGQATAAIGETQPLKLTARANCVYENYVAQRAVDGNRGTMWNGRGKSPQWIEFDLGDQCRLDRVVLHGEGSPNAKTYHEVWLSACPIGDDVSTADKLARLRHSPEERGNYVLEIEDRPTGRYLQLRTINSWWAEWYEIEVEATPGRGISPRCEDIRDSLILHYPLDDRRNDGAVLDESDRGNNGIDYVRSELTDGVLGHAYQFDGKSEFIACQYDPDGGLHPTDTPFTLSAWFKTASSSPVEPTIVSTHYAGAGRDGYMLSLDNKEKENHLRFMLVADKPCYLYSKKPCIEGRWHHAIAVWDGHTASLFLDGVLQDSADTVGAVRYPNQIPLVIGHCKNTGDSLHRNMFYFFLGAIDDIRFYQRALSASEVVVLHDDVLPEVLQIQTTTYRKSSRDFAREQDGCVEVGMGDSHWGFGAVGYELRNVRRVRAAVEKLEFHRDQWHDWGFAGFTMHYHTAEGYTKHVVLALRGGMKHYNFAPTRWAVRESRSPDPIVRLERQEEYDFDLSAYAPPDWDGQAWFNVVLQNGPAGSLLRTRLTFSNLALKCQATPSLSNVFRFLPIAVAQSNPLGDG